MEKCNTCQYWRPNGEKTIGTCSVWSSLQTGTGKTVWTEPFECTHNFGCHAHKELTRFSIPSFEFGIKRRASC